MKVHAPSQEDPILREQFVVIARLLPAFWAIILISAIALSATFSDWLQFAFMRIFLTVILGVSFVRMIYWRKVGLKPRDFPAEKISRIIRTVGGICVSMSAYSATVAVYIFQTDPNMASVLLMIVVWGMSLACALCLFSMPRLGFLCVLTADAPILAALFFQPQLAIAAVALILMALTFLFMFLRVEFYKSFLTIVSSRQKLEDARRQAAHQALTDPLTNLANRRAVDEWLSDHALSGATLMVAMIDLDDFKRVNDLYGKGVGDYCLKLAARRLQDMNEKSCLLARVGGDEFAILSQGLETPQHAKELTERFVAALKKPFLFESVRIELSVCAGVAFVDQSASLDDRLLERADIALFAAKVDRREPVQLFSPQLEQAARERAAIEQALRRAITEDEFEIHFQPIIRISDGRIMGFESLARWRDHNLGSISPAVFIPIAEHLGLIEALTDQLLPKAAKIAKYWPESVRLSFNLSAAQLVNPGAALHVARLLTEAGLPLSRFEAEVTETAIMQDVKAARHTLEALKNAGAHVALDDFGSGYSSFGQLCNLPFDRVKIDKIFVDRLLIDPKAAKVVKAMIGMCKHLDVDCVAEGIEDENHFNVLRQLGCGLAQGYYLARPGDASAAQKLLDAQEAMLSAHKESSAPKKLRL